MKTRILLTTIMLLLLTVSRASSQETGTSVMKDEPVKIFTPPENRSLTELWISEYRQINPDFNYELTPISFSEISSTISGDQSIGFFIQPTETSATIGSMWSMALGREVIVAVINKENPYTELLAEKGVSPNGLAQLIESRNIQNWSNLLGNEERKQVNVYMLDEPEVKFSTSKFLEVDPSEINDLDALSPDAFLEAVKNDKYALGFCRLSAISKIGEQNFEANIQLLPIDRNNNGKLDYNEDFYSDPEQFERSVWIGKYPHSMVYNIYAVSSTIPKNMEINNFLSWITTSGQAFVEQSGYNELVYAEKQSNLEKLNISSSIVAIQPDTKSSSAYFWGILAMLLIALFITTVIYFIRKRKAQAPLLSSTKYVRVLSENSLTFPEGLYFDKTHTWAFMEKGGRVRIGIDDFIPNVTGNLTQVIMKSPGEKVKRMEPLVTLTRKGKQITLNAPVSGTITEINESLVNDPLNINKEPYGKGWVYKIEPSNWLREIQFFKLGDRYREWIGSEFIRLKDFLACSLHIMSLEGEKPAFQEGGELMLHPLKDLDPKVWEDFQNYFIKTADMY